MTVEYLLEGCIIQRYCQEAMERSQKEEQGGEALCCHEDLCNGGLAFSENFSVIAITFFLALITL